LSAAESIDGGGKESDKSSRASSAGSECATKPNWRFMESKFSNVFTTKSGMVEPTSEQFQKWIQNGISVDFVRMDNAGENMLLQKRIYMNTFSIHVMVFKDIGCAKRELEFPQNH
jgi:hypothetical protein